MKRLLLWNFLLAVCATAGIYELHREWTETRAQQEAILLRKPAQPKVEATPLPAKPAPFQAVTYSEVAQKTLFAKDRNPNIEPPPPPAPPPPPPPMPALPKMYGVLGLPSGSVAIMAEKSGAMQTKVRVGDSVGEFKIAKLDTQHITLLWKDKTVEKSVDELLDRTPVAAAGPEPPARGVGVMAANPPPAAGPTVPPVMGIEVGSPGHSVRSCKPDDTSPVGTELAGYRKTKEITPFGEACRWQQTNQ